MRPNRLWLRAIAIVIAIAGVIDPAIAKRARVKPEVSLIGSGPLPDDSLIDRVARSLEPIATVIRGASIGASATVSVGYQLPSPDALETPLAFAVRPTARAPFVTIDSIKAPAHGNLEARVPVSVTFRVRAARGRTLTAALEINGVAVDQAKRTVAGDDETMQLELGLLSTRPGPLVAAVTARVDGSNQTAAADVSMRIAPDRHAVLFFDRRPSWMSTFVRRALESDPRFVVSSRTATSRGAGTVVGAPPATLASTGLDAFELIMVGAPDSLTPEDTASLDSFMRTTGGTVCLLMDAGVASPAIDRLTGVTQWTGAIRPEPSGVPLASETWRPQELPKWATGDSIVWQMAVGSGRLIVSGALDSWRFRGRGGFDRYWRLLAADATAQTGAAPETALRKATPDRHELIRAWVSSHGGTEIADDNLAALSQTLAQRLNAPEETVTIHPMRSVWWLIPFAGCLGFEWWSRRRAGLK